MSDNECEWESVYVLSSSCNEKYELYIYIYIHCYYLGIVDIIFDIISKMALYECVHILNSAFA